MTFFRVQVLEQARFVSAGLLAGVSGDGWLLVGNGILSVLPRGCWALSAGLQAQLPGEGSSRLFLSQGLGLGLVIAGCFPVVFSLVGGAFGRHGRRVAKWGSGVSAPGGAGRPIDIGRSVRCKAVWCIGDSQLVFRRLGLVVGRTDVDGEKG